MRVVQRGYDNQSQASKHLFELVGQLGGKCHVRESRVHNASSPSTLLTASISRERTGAPRGPIRRTVTARGDEVQNCEYIVNHLKSGRRYVEGWVRVDMAKFDPTALYTSTENFATLQSSSRQRRRVCVAEEEEEGERWKGGYCTSGDVGGSWWRRTEKGG